MTPDEALDAIRLAWIGWALETMSAEEFASRVAEALEAAGKPLISSVDAAAND